MRRHLGWGETDAAQTEIPYRGFESHSLRQLRRSRVFSTRTCWHLSPMVAAISHLNSGLRLGRARPIFSERPIYLRSSALRGFGTVLEIQGFRVAYEF